jgi:hypothetical protein
MKNIIIIGCLFLVFFNDAHAQWQSFSNDKGIVLDDKRDFLRAKGSVITFIADNYLYVSQNKGEFWTRNTLPVQMPNGDKETISRFFDITITSKGIYIFNRTYAGNNFTLNYSADFGRSWLTYKDVFLADDGYPSFSSDDSTTYFLFNYIRNNALLLNCTNGANNWTADNRFSNYIKNNHFKVSNKNIVYIKKALLDPIFGIRGDTLVLANKKGNIIAQKNIGNSDYKSELYVSDSLVLFEQAVYDLNSLKLLDNLSPIFPTSTKASLKLVLAKDAIYSLNNNGTIDSTRNFGKNWNTLNTDILPTEKFTDLIYTDSIFYLLAEDNVYYLKISDMKWNSTNTGTIPSRIFTSVPTFSVFDSVHVVRVGSHYEYCTKDALKWRHIPTHPAFKNNDPIYTTIYYWEKNKELFASVSSFGNANYYKLSNISGSWEKTTVNIPGHPLSIKPILVGDTTIYKISNYIYLSTPPYNQDSAKVLTKNAYTPYNTSLDLYYDNGFIYYFENNTTFVTLVKANLKGNIVERYPIQYSSPSDISNNLYIDKNKIFSLNENNIRRSLDGGVSVQDIFSNTQVTRSPSMFLTRLSNKTLMASTKSDSTISKGGIYFSVDDGTSWFTANDGLTPYIYIDALNRTIKALPQKRISS